MQITTRRLTVMAMLIAVSVILVWVFHMPLIPAAPYLEYDRRHSHFNRSLRVRAHGRPDSHLRSLRTAGHYSQREQRTVRHPYALYRHRNDVFGLGFHLPRKKDPEDRDYRFTCRHSCHDGGHGGRKHDCHPALPWNAGLRREGSAATRHPSFQSSEIQHKFLCYIPSL